MHTEGAQGVLTAANKTAVEERLQKDKANMTKTLHASTKKSKHSSNNKGSEGDADTGGGGPMAKKAKRKKPKLSKALSKKNTGLLSFADDE
tara:strand:- start:254 stop:526 length:273 start_codon:yes stop_codon:yes gene_type:complete